MNDIISEIVSRRDHIWGKKKRKDMFNKLRNEDAAFDHEIMERMMQAIVLEGGGSARKSRARRSNSTGSYRTNGSIEEDETIRVA